VGRHLIIIQFRTGPAGPSEGCLKVKRSQERGRGEMAQECYQKNKHQRDGPKACRGGKKQLALSGLEPIQVWEARNLRESERRSVGIKAGGK